ncbi:Rho GTPase-activating protein 4 [Glycine max]|nr:Rho GTPase-activating protein 4 [Glycine max]
MARAREGGHMPQKGAGAFEPTLKTRTNLTRGSTIFRSCCSCTAWDLIRGKSIIMRFIPHPHFSDLALIFPWKICGLCKAINIMQLWCLCNGLDREHAGHQSVGGEQQLQPSMLLQEVGVVVLVLLGFAPPSTFFAASSSKVIEIISDVLFLLENNQFLYYVLSFHDNPMCSNSFWSTNSDKVGIELPDETDVSVVSLDEQLEDWTDKEISDFSSLIGGSYAPDALEPLNGVLTIPLTNDASVNLHILIGRFMCLFLQKAERKFIVGLMSLTHNVQRAIQMHDNLSQSAKGPTELLTGCFNGFKGCKSRGIKLCGPLAAAGMIAAWTSKCLPNYQREKYVAWTSSHSEQLSFDARGNSVPTILLLMQRHLYAQGGLQAWFRELPTRVLDPFSPEQVMQSQSEEECAQLVRLLPPTEVALLDWAINLMADVTQMENLNNMNARNIAMVFAPNMTQFCS